MKYMQSRESFSFSTSSKAGLFSDDEEGDADGHDHIIGRTSAHRQNDYFEICLPPPAPSPSTKTDHGDSKEEEFEFCFSFNSSSTLVEFPATPISAISNHPFHNEEPPTSTSTSTTSQLVNFVDKKHKRTHKTNKSLNYKRILQNASSPRCHQGLVSPYIFPPSRMRSFDETQEGLINNRLSGIRKFMVKLRSIKSMLRTSLNASRRLQPREKVKVNKNKKACNDQKQIDSSHITSKNNQNKDIIENTHNQNQIRKEEKTWTRVNLNGVSKMFDVIMKNIITTRRSTTQRDSKSCPVSIKSSPMHDPSMENVRDHERRHSFYSKDHSIQAAIAHCKKSFGK